jgi:hypothetical protein
VGATVGTKKGQVVTAPKGGGGLDASLLLTNEQLRTENAYDRCPHAQRSAASAQVWCQCWRHSNMLPGAISCRLFVLRTPAAQLSGDMGGRQVHSSLDTLLSDAACSFSTFTAAVIRSLVGFYDISYADGLAVCGATAREMLTYGQTPVYTMMPAVDTSYPGAKKLQTQDFLVGRLDQNVSNGATPRLRVPACAAAAAQLCFCCALSCVLDSGCTPRAAVESVF